MRSLWSKPDPPFSDAGYSAEVSIAGMRLLLAVIVLYMPLRLYVQAPFGHGHQFLLGVAGLILVEASLLHAAVRRHRGRSWIGFASGILDVTLVSGALAIFLWQGRALHAAPSMVLFPAYFLAIGATSLRYDARICLVSGAAMVAQYGVLALVEPMLVDVGGGAVAEHALRLGLLAGAAALAVTIVVRAQRLRLLSISDGLTGLANRGYFDERLREEGAAASRASRRLGIIMIDIDHFKRFNDTYGHRAGDEALQTIGRLLRRSFRATDVVARYGGEELAVILPGIQPADALRRAESVRAAIESVGLAVAHRGLAPRVTVSVGLATWPDDGATMEEVLLCADRRLYEAKRLGRNRVCTAQVA